MKRTLILVVAGIVLSTAGYFMGFMHGSEQMHQQYAFMDVVWYESDTLPMVSSEYWKMVNHSCMENGDNEHSKQLLAKSIYLDYYTYWQCKDFPIGETKKIYQTSLAKGYLSRNDVMNAFPCFSNEATIDKLREGKMDYFEVSPSCHMRFLFIPEILGDFRNDLKMMLEDAERAGLENNAG